jgi:hypothetical protein
LVALAVALIATAGACAGSSTGGADGPGSTVPRPAPTIGLTTSPRAGTTTSAAPATTTTGASPRSAVDRLVVAQPPADLPDYRRAEFGDGWDYDPSTGCNVRERVLIAESSVAVTFGTTRCHPVAGRWLSLYDGLVTTDPTDLQIDHLVPLGDAWRSGAATWTPDRRRAYANDLTDPNTLVAVSARTNESKGDSSPDEWMPPDRTSWCTYADRWVEVKARWHLSVTPSEKSTLVQILEGC